MSSEKKQREPWHEDRDYKVISLILSVVLVVILVVAGAAEVMENEDDENGGGSDGSNASYDPIIDPDNFVDTIDNPYLPFAVGNKWVFEAETEDGTERIEVEVTGETKTVMDITCTVVRDTVTLEGELIEDTYDWYAQDVDGNVWYMGEDSREYEDGEVVSTAGSWEGGVDGARPGIIMMAKPLAGFSYRQEYYKGEAEDMAEVVHLDEKVTIDYGSFDEVVVTYEWTPLEPGVVAYKYYAPGVGVFQEIEGDEVVELTEFTTA